MQDLRVRIQELAARASPRRASAAAAADGSPEPMDAAGGGSGYATPDDEPEPGAAADAGPDPGRMTIAEMKAWLMEAGHEAKVWELTQGKAKKAQWVAFMRSVA